MSGFDREALLRAPERFAHEQPVLFQHVDAAGIVFYARMFDTFHDAYVGLLEVAGHPLPQALAERRWIAPLVHAEADYLSPLRFGDRVRCAVVRTERDGSKVRIGYRVTVGERVAAVGHTVHVWVDPGTMKRAPMPEGLAAWFDAQP